LSQSDRPFLRTCPGLADQMCREVVVIGRTLMPP
jgi:hypothetical protein